MGIGKKIGIGCGGFLTLMVVVAIVNSIGGKIVPALPAPQTNPQILQAASKDLFAAYHVDPVAANVTYKGKYIKIQCLSATVEQVVASTVGEKKDIGDALHANDIDQGNNDDGKPDIEGRAKRLKITSDEFKSTIPSVMMTLGVKNRKLQTGAKDATVLGIDDVIFVFDSHPDDLTKLSIGKKVRIVGRVDGLFPESENGKPSSDPLDVKTIIIRDCRLVN
jgi:hypothetical protein